MTQDQVISPNSVAVDQPTHAAERQLVGIQANHQREVGWSVLLTNMKRPSDWYMPRRLWLVASIPYKPTHKLWWTLIHLAFAWTCKGCIKRKREPAPDSSYITFISSLSIFFIQDLKTMSSGPVTELTLSSIDISYSNFEKKKWRY